jgi:hypothetical protein
LIDVEELLRPQVLIAFGQPGVDRCGIDDDLDITAARHCIEDNVSRGAVKRSARR